MEPVRIYNVGYAFFRLLGLVVILALVGVTWVGLFMSHGVALWHVLTIGAILFLVIVVAGHVALLTAWWIELDGDALRCMTLLGRRTYKWSEIAQVRPIPMALTDLGRFIPLLRRDTVVFITERRARIIVRVRPRGAALLAQHVGPRWSEQAFPDGRTGRWRGVLAVGSTFLWLLLLLFILLMCAGLLTV